ncbi:MAG TPA: hypothetical protein VM262_08725, partial [Acidimicrobiales bacterium]|nr:hypothetical protein [Acidimicrobiales bacterium]
MATQSRRLGEFLVERKVLSREALEVCLQREQTEGRPLTALLVSSGLVGEKDLVAAIADAAHKRFVDLSEHVVPTELDRLIPAELAVRHSVVAVDTVGDELLVAMVDAGDKEAVAAVETATGWKVQPALAVRGEVKRLLAAMYGAAAQPSVVEIDLVEAASAPKAAAWGMDPDAPEELHINDLLERVLDLGGSDLHLTVGVNPSVRVNGDLKRLTEFPVMNGSEIRRMVYAILTQKQREKFEAEHELDTSHSIPGRGRFRVNVFL